MGDPVSIGVMTLASVGMSAASKGLATEGTASADQFKAQQLEEASTYGELKAQQTNAQLSRNLTISLGNIDAVRAAARADPSSPSGAAVRDYVESTETTNKGIQVSSIEQQARMDESGAAYMRDASSTALLGGDLSVVGTLLGGAAGAAKGGGGFNIPGFNPIAGVSGG